MQNFIPYSSLKFESAYDEIIGDHQYGFRRNRIITYQVAFNRQILKKKWEYNETVYQLFVDFKEVYHSVRRDVLYNILIQLHR
jgi:hypothetical protein